MMEGEGRGGERNRGGRRGWEPGQGGVQAVEAGEGGSQAPEGSRESISRQGEPGEGAGPACWEVTSKLRRGPLPGQGPTTPQAPEADIAQGLITLSHLSPGPTAAVTSQYPVALCRVGSQASPPARRVQDRREVLLGKSLEEALPAQQQACTPSPRLPLEGTVC